MTTPGNDDHDQAAGLAPRAGQHNASDESSVPRVSEAVAAGAEGVLRAMLADSVIPSIIRSARASAPVPGDAERDLLLRLVLRGERDGAIALMRQCIVAGMRAERLADDMIPTVARALGEEWESDSCDFVRVTYGSGLLAELMRELRELDPPRVPPPGHRAPRRSILLSVVPGEQHTLGVSVLADGFERAGWDVSRAENVDAAGLMAQLSRTHVDVVGLSVGADRNLEGMKELIALLRRIARNRSLKIIVGGTLLMRRPEVAHRLGVDGLALDSAGAVELAASLCAARARVSQS